MIALHITKNTASTVELSGVLYILR